MRRFRVVLVLLSLLLLCSCGAGEGESGRVSETETTVTTETTAAETPDGDPWFLADSEDIILMEPGYPGLVCEGELRELLASLLREIEAKVEAGQVVENDANVDDHAVHIWFWVNFSATNDNFNVHATEDGRCWVRWLTTDAGRETRYFSFESVQCADLVRTIYDTAEEEIHVKMAEMRKNSGDF